jgi:hypothetical protein
MSPGSRCLESALWRRHSINKDATGAFRAACRVATAPMTARDITDKLLEGKTPAPTRKQAVNIQPAVLSARRNHADKGVERVGEAFPARWKLKETAN